MNGIICTLHIIYFGRIRYFRTNRRIVSARANVIVGKSVEQY